ncbi:N-6 DNA methylase [Nocardia sp. alder85J]|uniref:N-6 DNA methylase n=1 Tax=Nocardia sp. alder85J TaxID=2862949 RepID=UPI001CD458A5|nr:N-6 DNA methylase [Nocardia sp. alder85J]MCX4092089.1 N-6 DNA methylase [Nocardia sp. alder85J]
MTGHDTTLTAADIARMTGYGRAAVSNWRRRYADFPRPVGGTAASPQFSLVEVEQWLIRTGKKTDVSDEERIWQQIRSETEDLRLARAIADIGHRMATQQTEGSAPALLQQLISKLGASPSYEFIVARYLEAHARRVAVTPAETARLMVQIAEVDAAYVFDPACGVGTLLKAAADAGAGYLAGQDHDADAVAIATSRLSLAGGKADFRHGDSLRENLFEQATFDVAVCDPPFRDRFWGSSELSSDLRWAHGLPPRGEPELAWVQHLLWHLKPGGRAVILLPAAVSARTSGRRIRASLIRAGALRAVFALSAGAASGSSAAPHLWVLRQPVQGDPLPARVLLADVADKPIGHVLDLWRRFLAEPETELPVGCAVPLIVLLDDRVDVTPIRSEETAGQGNRELSKSRSELSGLLAEATRAITTSSDLVPVSEVAATVTLGQLLRSGALSLFQTPARMEVSSGDLPVLTVTDIVAGRPPSGWTTDAPGLIVLEPGDIVVSVTRIQTEPHVVTTGGVAAGPQLQVLRPEPDRLDSDFLACSLHAALRARPVSSSASSRSELHRTPVALLAIADQRSYGAAYQRLRSAARALQQARDQGDLLITQGISCLAEGTLRPKTDHEV